MITVYKYSCMSYFSFPVVKKPTEQGKRKFILKNLNHWKIHFAMFVTIGYSNVVVKRLSVFILLSPI